MRFGWSATFTILTLLLIAGVCSAQCGTHYSPTFSYSYPAVQVVKQVVQEKPVVPVYTPVAVPVYQAFYVPGYTPPVAASEMPQKQMPQAQATGSASSDLQQILSAIQGVNNKVDSLDVRLRAVEAGGRSSLPGATPSPAPPPSPHAAPRGDARQPTAADGLVVLNNKCAQCHETKTATKGRNVVLLQGKTAAKWSDRTLVQFLKVLGKGTMPPADSGHAPLTDFETGALFTLADSFKTAP